MTMESLPPEKRITGRSNSPATSRKMCTASDSSASRCDSGVGWCGAGVARAGRQVVVRRHTSPLLGQQRVQTSPADSSYAPAVGLDPQLGVLGCLVRVVDTGQAGQLTGCLPGVQALDVTFGAHLDRGGDVHLQVGGRRGRCAGPGRRRGCRRTARSTGTRVITPLAASSSATRPIRSYVGVPVGAREAEVRREEAADLVAVEHLDAGGPPRGAGRRGDRRGCSCPRSAGRSARRWHRRCSGRGPPWWA